MTLTSKPDRDALARASMDIKPAHDSIVFDEPAIAQLLRQLPPEGLDSLPFGTLLLDHQGVVLRYNSTESQISGFSKEEVLGKKFFEDIAPCTKVPLFQGQFDALALGQLKDVRFEYVMRFRTGLTRVFVRMVPATQTSAVWLLIAIRSRATVSPEQSSE